MLLSNFLMGEFILDGLPPRPKGIQLEICAEDDRTLIYANELGEDEYAAFEGASASLEIGSDMNGICKER